MTYTINQNVDVNAQVDIGDINIHGHTISNSQNGTIVITTGSESHLDITYGAHISNLVLSGNDIGTKSSNANLTFTPHGSGIVKSNAAFEVGNINLTDNTISSTNTNGDILLSPNGTGNVGIGTTNPNAKLHVTGSSGKYALQVSGDSGSSDAQIYINGSTYGMAMVTNNALSSTYALNISNSSSTMLYLQNNGFLGIGTTSPKAPLQIFNANSGVTLSAGQRQYFDYNSGPNKDVSQTWTFNDVSIYALGDIVGNGYILSHASTTFSDMRIKDNIVDVQDDQCLQKLRLIKPKQYTYRDIAKRGTEPVWGFIAQEVKEVLDYAVSTIEKEIPNIYKLATVSSDRKTLIFPEPIVFEDEHKRVVLKTHQNKDVEVLVVSHTPTSLMLEEEVEQEDISVENQVFVYGQVIPDFHHLKKDAIFTVAIAALQEVDRRQTTDNERILELEGDLTEAQETIATQAQDIVTLKAQVAALMQHTGVTI